MNRHNIMAFTLLLMFCSCSRQYWYRIKYPFASNAVNKTIRFQLQNDAPALLGKAYEQEMTKFCLKKLAGQGLIESHTDKYDYDFVITVDVDSFEAGQRVWLGPLGDGMPSQTHIMQLSLSYYLYFRQTNIIRWSSKSAIYFFGKHKRDIRRSKSVAAYAIRTID